MSKMMSSSCLRLVAKLDERDQDAILTRLDQLQAEGVPAERAQIQAAIDVLTGLKKMAIPEDKDLDPDNPDIKRSADRNPMGFFSALARGIEAMPTKQAPAGAWKTQIKGLVNKGVVKQDEIEWSGIDDWLDLQGGKVSKGAVAEYLKQGGVKVEEVTLGATGLDGVGEMYVGEANDYGDEWAVFTEEGAIIGGTYPTKEAAEESMASMAQDLPSKYSQYTLPGGESYREVLLTLPVDEPARPAPAERPKVIDRGRDERGRAQFDVVRNGEVLDTFSNWGEAQDFALQVEQDESIKNNLEFERNKPKTYKSSHWDQKNVLAHIRVNDRTDADGARVLFVEEVQSDFGQEGKKKGFAPMNPEAAKKEADEKDQQAKNLRMSARLAERAMRSKVAEFRAANPDADQITDEMVADRQKAIDSIHEMSARAGELEQEARSIRDQLTNKSLLPAAPFVQKTEGWLNLALKRIIAMAVDGDYDKVAFVTGEQSADRYDLSKKVERIEYDFMPADTVGVIKAFGFDGERIVNQAAKPEELPDIIGKEVAANLMAEPSVAGTRTLAGDGLSVGGEGMKAFYDKIVPNAAKALLKKVGGGQMTPVRIQGPDSTPPEAFRVGEDGKGGYAVIWRSTGEQISNHATRDEAKEAMRQRIFGDATEQPGFTITDAMREKVSTEGLPLFSGKRSGGALESEPSDVVVDSRNPYAKLIRDPLSRETIGEKGRDFLRFFGDLLVLEGVQPSVDEGFGDGLVRNAELLRNLYRTESGVEKSYSSLDTPSKRMVVQAVGNAINNLEVLRSVVKAIPVDVMDILGGKQRPTNRNTGDVSMLGGGPTIDADVSVSTAIDVAANAVSDVAAAKRAKDSAGIWDLARESLDGGATAGARAGDFWQDDGLSIRRSTGRTASGQAWESPTETAFDNIVYKLQDKHVDLRRVIEAIQAAGSAIRDDLDVYLQEELYHGRAAKRTEDFVNMELNPLVEQLAKDGLKLEDLEEFLHARHAPEANKVIAARNPGNQGLQDGGSGMMTAEALNYMATLPADMRQKLEAAAAKVDAIIGKTRQLYVDYELESKSTVDGWGQVFKHYIPLQREDKNGSPGLGQGFSIKGKETKGRTGSTRKVVDILANIALQREKAITRGEKNRVSQALVGLAASNPNEDFWQVDEVPTERVFNPDTGLVEDRVDPLYKSRDNAVIAKIADSTGRVREHAVLFNEEDPRALRMAQSLKNLDAANLEGLLGVSAKVSRYFAAVNTQWNPVFGVVNLVRDVQGALLNLSTTPLAGEQAKIAKYTMSALRGVYGDARAARNGKNPSSQWAALWDEFQEVGGQTGYRELFKTSADRAEAIKDVLNPDAWADSKLGKIFTANGVLKVPMAQAKRGAGFIFDWLSDYNLAMENGVRLAAYKAGIESGMSKERAASAAKNLTVNFNRKGQVSQQAGAMYAFFNASVQGTARIAQTIFEMEPGKPKTLRLSPMGKKVVYGGMILGSIQALALAAAGFNDDDPPDFARERSLIIPIGGKKYVTIPMPLGFHVLPSIGRVMTEFALSGFKDPHKRALSLASLFADTFNPIGNAGLSMQTLAPTMLDPFVALTENKDYTGKPIARESSNKAIPGHALGRDTATSVAMLLSEAINYASGGNKYTAGVFSPTPDQIDYLIGQVTGGVGRELSKVEQSVLATARGEDLPTYKVPLAGRFFGDAKSQASEGAAFYANSERLNKLETEIKGLQKDGKTAEASELRRNSSEAYLITVANHAERQIQKLRSEKRELVHNGAPRDQVVAIEEKITGVMARLNRAVEALREKQEN